MSDHQEDYQEIRSVLIRYASALDKKEYERLKEVFIPEATASYPGVGECKNLDSIIELVSGVLDRCGPTQHLLGNFNIEIQGREAMASCYLQAIHVGLGEYAGQLLTVWGEYRDRLVKTEAGWRIKHRELPVIHAQGDIGLA